MGAVLTAIATMATIAAAGTGVASAMGAFDESPSQPALPTLEAETPEVAPQVKAITEKTSEDARREAIEKRARRTKTLLTGPRGTLDVAQTGKKVLLGG